MAYNRITVQSIPFYINAPIPVTIGIGIIGGGIFANIIPLVSGRAAGGVTTEE